MNANRANLSCKNGPKIEIKHKGTEAGPKWKISLQQSLRGAQKKTFYSLYQATKQLTNKPKIPCKNRPKRELKKQVVAGVLKQQKVLNQT